MKLKYLIMMILVVLIVLLFPQISNAASSVVLEEIEVITEEGTYVTGDVIEFKAKFSGNVVGENDDASLGIKFGESRLYGSHYIYPEGTISGNTIIFKHIIEDTDSGELSLQGFSSSLEDENGDYIFVEPPTELTGNTIIANPMKWTDTSNTTMEVSVEDTQYYLNISNMPKLVEHSYYIFFTNNDEEPEVTVDENGIINNSEVTFYEKIYFESQLELNGDIYAWIYEEQKNYATGEYENKLIIGEKVERPAQKALGQRMKIYFLSSRTSSFLMEPCEDIENRKINIKIGKVENRGILNSIKNNEPGALGKLLEYAKNANSIYTATVPLGEAECLTSKMNLVDEEYYYVYLELEDENGKYYPVEDIDLAQAYQLEDNQWFMYGYTDTNFSWKDNGDDFSDFSEAKVGINELVFEGNTEEQESFKEFLTLKIYNIVANPNVQHQFYYYISNSKTDVPDISSNLWTKAESFIIDPSTGACQINTTDITKLSYYRDLNFGTDIYMYVYEVIGNDPITSETISGDYKLVLNAKTLSWEEKEDGKDDTVIQEPEIPQTGATPEGIIIAIIAIVILSVAVIKMKEYKDIK